MRYFIVNDPNGHAGHEGKFYRHLDVGHRTLCQLSSGHGLGIYSYSAKTALTTIFRVFPEGKVWDSKVRSSLAKNARIRFLSHNSYFNKIIRLKRMSSPRDIRRNRKFPTLFLKTRGRISTERITASRLFHHFREKLQYNSTASVHISSLPLS